MPPAPRRGQADETRKRMGQRGHPYESWLNVLSHAHRLCSSLCRNPERHEVFVSWGLEGRQKAIQYLEPLHQDIYTLMRNLVAMEAAAGGKLLPTDELSREQVQDDLMTLMQQLPEINAWVLLNQLRDGIWQYAESLRDTTRAGDIKDALKRVEPLIQAYISHDSANNT